MLLKNKIKLTYISIGILLLAIISFEITLTRKIYDIKYSKDKLLVIEQKNYMKKEHLIRHKVSKDCILLHNYIIKNTGISLSNLNVRIMKFLKEDNRTNEEYKKLLEGIIETLNETNLLLDKYNEKDHLETEKNTKNEINKIISDNIKENTE